MFLGSKSDLLTSWSGVEQQNTVGSRFTTGLRSGIFGCKSNRHKTSTV